jgi:hypothetical protein
LTGWTGGDGTVPTNFINQFIGANGFTPDPLLATNVKGSSGSNGLAGWSPALAVIEVAPHIQVMQLTGWTGGQGTAPTTNVGSYFGPSGFVTNIEQGLNIKGQKGFAGWSPVFASETIGAGTPNEKVVLKVVGFTGGTGSEPIIPTNAYVTPTGYGTAAAATNVKGATGATPWVPMHAPFYRTPIEVVLQIVGYTGGTGTAPTMPDVEESFLLSDGTYGDINEAARINPEDSLDNRLQHIKDLYTGQGVPVALLSNLITSTKYCLTWISTNTGTEFSQVDALSVFKMSMRNIMYHVNRGFESADLPTFPASIVSPSLKGEIEILNLSDTQIPLFNQFVKDFFRAICDFDGELEARYVLGDVDDTYTPQELAELEAIFDWFINVWN